MTTPTERNEPSKEAREQAERNIGMSTNHPVPERNEGKPQSRCLCADPNCLKENIEILQKSTSMELDEWKNQANILNALMESKDTKIAALEKEIDRLQEGLKKIANPYPSWSQPETPQSIAKALLGDKKDE